MLQLFQYFDAVLMSCLDRCRGQIFPTIVPASIAQIRCARGMLLHFVVPLAVEQSVEFARCGVRGGVRGHIRGSIRRLMLLLRHGGNRAHNQSAEKKYYAYHKFVLFFPYGHGRKKPRTIHLWAMQRSTRESN